MTPVETLLFVLIFALGIPALALGGRTLVRRLRRGGILGAKYLCDRCMYDSPRYCTRPERPNATSCPEFKQR